MVWTFPEMHHNVCHKFTHTTPCTVTRNDVCMNRNITSFDRSVISKECTMQADAFIVDENCDKVGEEMPDNDNIDEDPNQTMNVKSPS